MKSGWTAGSEKSDGKPQPARKVIRSRAVIGRTAGTTSSTGEDGVGTTTGDASSGSHRAIGSSRSSCPSSTRIIPAAAVIGFVMEATRKIVSGVIAALPSRSSEPAAASSISSLRATSATTPGASPVSTKDWTRLPRSLTAT